MSQSVATAAHCINPNCPRPYHQDMGNNFCNVCGSSLRLLNRYIPLKRLGTGGFATIYTVFDQKTRTERVLKLLLETSPKAIALFEQEAKVMASLRHLGVPKVDPDSYFFVTLGNSPPRVFPCLVMEKITGQTLEDILEHYPQGCPEAWVLNWFKQAVHILRELHKRRIIHRDIKPSNLMLREGSGQLVVIDFGGAKQITPNNGNGYPISSTRLFSPGYSPPEQITGAQVGASADFYALGMTCIHLLTGQYPLDLEDPKTGNIKWRQYAKVNPAFATLLDDMVRPNVAQRPAHANEILARIRKFSSKTITSSLTIGLFQFITSLIGNFLKLIFAGFTLTGKSITQLISTVLRLIMQVVRACLSTLWEMLLGGIGAGLGAAIGCWLAYKSPIVTQFQSLFTQELSQDIINIQLVTKPGFMLFILAGLGTALGLKLAGRFNQQQRYLLLGLMSTLGYGLGWFIMQKTASDLGIAPDDLVQMTAVTGFLLALGLGLPSHNLVYALVTAVGTASFFNLLLKLVVQFLPFAAMFGVSDYFFANLSWGNFWFSVIFFSLLAIAIAFWLGITHYIVVPFLKRLGWR